MSQARHRRSDPNASVAWLPPPEGSNGLAGAAFLVGEDVALTCAHAVRDHLGLGKVTPAHRPDDEIVLKFVALDQEVRANVASCGWLPDADIAVLSLAEPLDVTCATPANALPTSAVSCYAYGCPGDTVRLYNEHGQMVYLTFRPQLDGRRMHQLQPQQSADLGFTIKRGFSGAPVFDELGNVVFGMVVRTDDQHRVALAIPASDLDNALREVRRCARQAGRAEPTIAQRPEGPLDQIAASTLSFVRQGLSERLPEASGVVSPAAELRGAFRQAAEEAREPNLTEAVRQALERVREGDSAPLEALLLDHADRLMDAAGKAAAPGSNGAELRQLAAEAFRHLGAVAVLRNVADGLDAYRRAAELDPNDTWTWIFISRLERAAGRLPAAETAASSALSSARERASVREDCAALMELGDVAIAAGRLADAVRHFEAIRSLFEERATADPGTAQRQRDLSVSWEKIGNVRVAQGDLDGALDAHMARHAIAEKLAAADPGNARWQHDLSVSWEKTGNVRVAQGDLDGALDAYEAGKAIRDELAAADPGNAEWQRGLSVTWNKIGDVRAAQGDLAGALDAYALDLAIAEKLAAADPGNAEWQRDLSVSWDRIGDVREAQGELTGALDAYAAAKAIRDELAAADPGNAEWQRDLIVSHVKLSGLLTETADARPHLTAALKIARAMETAGRLAPVDAFIPGMLEERLAALDW